MHGTVRLVLTVDGERISSADIQIGYLHRCFEKESEYATWTQMFPYTDRLNYVSPMLNNVGYAMAVEKLLGIDGKIPERAQYIRVIVGEMSRITDHLTCLGASRDGAGRVHRVPVRAQGARVALRAARGSLRRAAHPRTCASAASPPICRPAWTRAARDPRRDAGRDHEIDKLLDAQPHLPRPHGRHRHRSPRPTPSPSAAPARSGRRGASPTTCARTIRTRSTTDGLRGAGRRPGTGGPCGRRSPMSTPPEPVMP